VHQRAEFDVSRPFRTFREEGEGFGDAPNFGKKKCSMMA